MTNNIDKSALISFRAFSPYTDTSFIFSTWLKGLRFGNSWYRLIDSKIYFKIYHRVIEDILSRPVVEVRIACLKEDPEVILGYSVFEGNRLHWVHVKQVWRKIGIANDLVPKSITTVSHLTDIGKSIVFRKNLIFNPFLLT